MEDFQVRMAEAGDAEGVSMLVSGMPNSSDIIELFNAALERKTAVVATVEVGGDLCSGKSHVMGGASGAVEGPCWCA